MNEKQEQALKFIINEFNTASELIGHPIGVITGQVVNHDQGFIIGTYETCFQKFKIFANDDDKTLIDQFGTDGLEAIRDAQFQRYESAVING